MMHTRALRVVLCAAVIGLASHALAGVTNIQDPAGKTVLVVDKDKVLKDGKTVLTIDGDKINDANGKMVLYINGDNILTEPNGKMLMFKDGRHFKREPQGTDLLYIDGNDLMTADRKAKLFRFTGEDMDSQQRTAVMYQLLPHLFTNDKANDQKILADQAKTAVNADAAAVKAYAGGNYSINAFRSSDPLATNLSGKIAIAKVGDVFALDLQLTNSAALHGVAIQKGDELWAAVGKPGTVGLAVYDVADGKLTGTWYNASGKKETFGSENATGDKTLGGDYKITEAKAPVTGAAYTGKLTLEALDKKFDKDIPIYVANWDLGGYKAKGVGFSSQKSLALATSSDPGFFIIRFKIDLKDYSLNGEFATAEKSGGVWNLKKEK